MTIIFNNISNKKINFLYYILIFYTKLYTKKFILFIIKYKQTKNQNQITKITNKNKTKI